MTQKYQSECPKCGQDLHVIGTRTYPNYIRRRYACKFCDYKKTTYENDGRMVIENNLLRNKIMEMKQYVESIDNFLTKIYETVEAVEDEGEYEKELRKKSEMG